MEEGNNILLCGDKYYFYNSETGVYEHVELEENSKSESVPVPIENPVSVDLNTGDVSPTPSSSHMSDMKKIVWDRRETLLFLEICKKNKTEISNPKNKKISVFRNIVSEMQKHNCKYSAEQCMNRLKTLIHKYKEIKDHNATSGNDRKSWEYYDLLAEYIGDNPTITPTASCSSLLLQKRSLDKAESEKENDQNEKKKYKITPRRELLHFLKKYEDDTAERERKRMELIEKHHMENTELMKELLNVLKK